MAPSAPERPTRSTDPGTFFRREPTSVHSSPTPLTVAGLRLKWHEVLAPARAPRDATTPRPDRDEIAFGLWVLDDPDALLDDLTQEEFEKADERMPYFGALWPSAESLAPAIVAGPTLEGLRVLDLGCGLGLCGFAAAHRGAHVTFLDWEPRALEIVEASALAQGLPLSTFDLITADWRKPPRLEPFDRILGADVLYEERNAEPVAAFLANHLKIGAEGWISDPNRPHARRFPALAQQAGLEFLGAEILPAQAHHLDVSLIRVRRSA